MALSDRKSQEIEAAEEIVQLVCNSFRVDDPPDIPWDVSVAEVRQRIERFAASHVKELKASLTAIIHGAMATENDTPCSICRPNYEHRHEEGCPILAAERTLGTEG